MKKQITTLALSLLLILGLIPLAFGGMSESANLQITLISQEPDPIEPGGILDVRFKVENIGGEATEDIIFEILPNYPFSVYTGSAVKNIGSLQGAQDGNDGVIVHYKIRVDKDAIEGNNHLDIRYKLGELTSKWSKIEDFVIRIRTNDIVLQIDEVESTPEVIPPGQKAKVKFTIKNLADSLVKDIKVKLDLSSDDLPFVPIKSTTEKKIYQIASKNETEITFDIMAMADAESQAYKIPLKISYYDLAGTSYEKEDIISLIVGAKPDLYVGVDSSEIVGKTKSGKITIRLVNKGVIDIKFLNVKLKESDDYEIISPNEVYIGSVDSDDYETVDFDLYVKSKENTIELPLTIEYMDANNNEYSPLRKIELKMYSSSDAKKYGLSKERGIGSAIIFFIVIGGLGIYIWRERKKGKKIFGKW